jgi:hypothetical protein
MSDLVTIASFDTFSEVYFVKARLDMADIDCVIIDEHLPRIAWNLAFAIGGVKLQVCAEDVDAALEVLASDIPERFSLEPGEEYLQPRCPKCGSLNTDEFDDYSYECETCDAIWEEPHQS